MTPLTNQNVPAFVQEARIKAKERLIFMEICDHVTGRMNIISGMDHGQPNITYTCCLCGMTSENRTFIKDIIRCKH